MKRLYSLLVLFPCSVSASSLSLGGSGAISSQQSTAVSTFTRFPTNEFAGLTISPKEICQDYSEKDILDHVRCSASFYSLGELDHALKALINNNEVSVDKASTILLNSPLVQNLNEETIDTAVWKGYHHFLRCLQNKKLGRLPLLSRSNKSNSSSRTRNPLRNLDERALHKLFAYSYKRSWSDPLFWKDHLHKMDWVEFWDVIFEVDNVQLFEDLFTQRLPLPFNRFKSLEKSVLSFRVNKYDANKIGAYLGIPRCQEEIIFDKDGRLDTNLLQWDDEFEKSHFYMKTTISAVVKLNDLTFLKTFQSTYPDYFPYRLIANEALLQARLDIFDFILSKSPKDKLKNVVFGSSIMRSDRLKERISLLYRISKTFPGWAPDRFTIIKLCPELLTKVVELYPNLRPVKWDFTYFPSYGFLKWALKNKPGWIRPNWHALSVAKQEGDLELFNFIYERYQEECEGLDRADALAFEMGNMKAIDFFMERHEAPKKEYLVLAAKSGHVQVLKSMAEKGYRIDFTNNDDALVEIANSGYVHVIKYIHANYPEAFKRPLYINDVLGEGRDADRESEMLKYLYKVFEPENIKPPYFNKLADLIKYGRISSLNFILLKYPTIVKDAVEKETFFSARWTIKSMVLQAAKDKHQKLVESLMGQIQGNLEWTRSDLCEIAKYGGFYLLDLIYKKQKENESLWNPIKYFDEHEYLQWYHLKVAKDLPWEDLAFKAARWNDRVSLCWILTQSPNVREAVERRLYQDRPIYAEPYLQNVLEFLKEKNEAAIYYIPKNSDAIEDEVSLYYRRDELLSRYELIEAENLAATTADTRSISDMCVLF